MFNFLGKRENKRPVRPLELVSVHIPKTAGTSFRQTLEAAYGKKAILRLDQPLIDPATVRVNTRRYEAANLPEGISVVHGHFNPLQARNRFPALARPLLITWLRDPVERVISNYYYLEKRLREELDEEGKDLDILSKMQRSLPEYARDEINRNRQSKFLEGVALEDFFFVGILEHYAADLAELGRKMGWEKAEENKVNVTASAKPLVSDQVRAEIAGLNAGDVALYERALHLRARRLQKPRVELLSIHVPKTAGTSFHAILRQVYRQGVSRPFRRMEILAQTTPEALLTGEIRVVHGHFHYPEICTLHRAHGARLICWLRDPVDRVVSNYHFFKQKLRTPDQNPTNYQLNKHRKNESLATYARLPENQNVMSLFLEEAALEDFFFIGFQETFAADVRRLAALLDWPPFGIENLNGRTAPGYPKISQALREEIGRLNAKDVQLYERAVQLTEQPPDGKI